MNNAPTILVVDDNLVNLELLSDVLELNGFLVCTATSAEAGLYLAKTKQPDLILMDISLPQMDGLAATRSLKQDPHTTHIPVIALTAHATELAQIESRKAGCAAHITKPFELQTLIDVVASYLT